MEEPHVDLATVPELAAILRKGWLSKVRVFQAYCVSGEDRLVQVVRVAGRPLAMGRDKAGTSEIHVGARHNDRKYVAHRAANKGMWLDLPPAYYVPLDRPLEPGESRVRRPYVLGVECQHESAPIPGWWLREQVEAGASRRMIDAATRDEMGVRARGD